MRKHKVRIAYFLSVGLVLIIFVTISIAGCSEQINTQVPTVTPMVTITPNPTEIAFSKLSFDFKSAMLTPSDIADLFQDTSYSIQQDYAGLGMQGVMMTYPTRVIEHTTGFAEGFATEIKIYADVDRSTRAFNNALISQSSATLDIEKLGDDIKAFRDNALSPEGFDVGSTEYVVLIRQGTVTIRIVLRTNQLVTPGRLGELVKLVLGRLKT